MYSVNYIIVYYYSIVANECIFILIQSITKYVNTYMFKYKENVIFWIFYEQKINKLLIIKQ